MFVALDGYKASPPAAEADLAPVQTLINQAYQGELGVGCFASRMWEVCRHTVDAAVASSSNSSGGSGVSIVGMCRPVGCRRPCRSD